MTWARALEARGGNRLDGSLRAYGHEDGSFDRAAACLQYTRPSARGSIAGREACMPPSILDRPDRFPADNGANRAPLQLRAMERGISRKRT